MDRLKEGIVEVGGIAITPQTTVEELMNVELDQAVQRNHPHGYMEIIFHHPVESDEVSFQVSVRIARKDESRIVLIDPKLKTPIHDTRDESRMKQEICEEWLKRHIDVPPTRDTDDGIFYDFDWGTLYSAAAEHIHFGNLEGCIQMTYEK